MLPGHYQYMRRGLRGEIPERDIVLALSHKRRAQVTARDATENAVFSHGRAPRSPFRQRGTLSGQLWCICTLPQPASMPELPEVETVRQSLLDRVVGRDIVDLRVGDFPGVVGTESPETVRARVTGRRFHDIRRRGKYLFFDLDDDTSIMIHLRMTGKLSLVSTTREELRHQRLAIELDNGRDLRFSDQRKFGRVLHLHLDDATRLDARIGIEPLADDFTPEWLLTRLARRTGKIKAVLLDQGLIGGLGNIYVDEALFAAGIHPERPADSLTLVELTRLVQAIRNVLLAALARRGTTFSSFEDADGQSGGYGANLRVYGKGGKALCPLCSGPLLRLTVAGRGTSYCPACQPITVGEET